MGLASTDRVMREGGVLAAPIDDEIVLLGPRLENYLALDDIGRRIWNMLEIPITVEMICARLSEEYDATPEQIAADVVPFLDELCAERLIRVAAANELDLQSP